jgi:hypothetical protein
MKIEIVDEPIRLHLKHTGGTIVESAKPTKTISQVFEEFLADQKGRISAKTFSKYQSIIQLYGSYLENYWPDHEGESSKVTKAGGTFCSTFGPEDVTCGYSEFLGYFMPRKVICGNDLMKAAGMVTKKLAKWLAEKGYVEDTEDAQERAAEAARDLPKTQTVLDIRNACCDEVAPLLQPNGAAKSKTIFGSTASSRANSG